VTRRFLPLRLPSIFITPFAILNLLVGNFSGFSSEMAYWPIWLSTNFI